MLEESAKWDAMTPEEQKKLGVHTLDGMIDKMKWKTPSHGHYKWSEFHKIKKG